MIHVKHTNSKPFKNILETKEFICFGAGKHLNTFLKELINERSVNNIVGILDNFKTGESIAIGDKIFEIQTPEMFAKNIVNKKGEASPLL